MRDGQMAHQRGVELVSSAPPFAGNTKGFSLPHHRAKPPGCPMLVAAIRRGAQGLSANQEFCKESEPAATIYWHLCHRPPFTRTPGKRSSTPITGPDGRRRARNVPIAVMGPYRMARRAL